MKLYKITTRAFDNDGEFEEGFYNYTVADSTEKLLTYTDSLLEDLGGCPEAWDAIFRDVIADEVEAGSEGEPEYEEQKEQFRQAVLAAGGVMYMDEYLGIEINFEHVYGSPDIYAGWVEVGEIDMDETVLSIEQQIGRLTKPDVVFL